MLITKRYFLVVVLCHLTLLFVKGQETTTSAAILNNDGVKGDGNENTPIVGESTGVTSEGTTTQQSTSTISQTNVNTTEQPINETATSTIQNEVISENSTTPSIELSTSTVEETINTTMTISSKSNVDESTIIPSTVTDGKTHQTSTAVVTDSNTYANETTVSTNTNKTTDNTVVKETATTTKSTSSSVGYETSSKKSEDSNLSTEKSTANPSKLTSLTTGTEKTTETSSKTATEITPTIDSSQETNTGVAGIVSPLRLSCKNYTINAFKPGHTSLPCTIHTNIDIDCNETALIWGENNKNKVTCGDVNYGVGLNITDDGAHNYTSDITFFEEAKLDKEVTMTIKIVLVNKIEKISNFTIKFIETPSGTAVNRVNVFSCLMSVFLLIVYLF